MIARCCCDNYYSYTVHMCILIIILIFFHVATVSEYQRFLHRLTCHKVLRVEQYFITFLTGSVEVCTQQYYNKIVIVKTQ